MGVRTTSPETGRRDPRRQAVEQVLAEWGLLGRPHRAARSAVAAGFAARLRTALEVLGPVFSSFGAYLATRVDLLPAADCLELAAIAQRPRPLPAAAARQRIAAALGAPAVELFAELAPEPGHCELLLQDHWARLRDGQAVLVRVAHPDADGETAADLALLELLGESFAAQGWGSGAAPEAVAGFRRQLQERTDLAAVAEGLERLAGDTAVFGILRVPAVRRALSAPTVLTVEALDGAPVAAVGRHSAAASISRQDLARRLCVVWLRQALLGELFPVEPTETGTLVLADGRIAFAPGAFGRSTADAQAEQRAYLLATAAHDLDAASEHLLRQVDASDAAAEERLRLAVRQVVPFRDGSWSLAGGSLAEHLFAQLRLAREAGCRPRPELLAFSRGLFAIAAAARRLAPERDALAEGLQELRLLASLYQVREAVTPERLRAQLEQVLPAMVELPRKLDQLLTVAAESSATLQVRLPEEESPRRGGGTALAAPFLALAALVLLWRALAPLAPAVPWSDEAAFGVALALGGLLLRAAVRGGERSRR